MVNCFICHIILRAGSRMSNLINKPGQEEEITCKRRDLAVLHCSRFRLINQDIEEDSKIATKMYPMLVVEPLKTELEVIYSREDFKQIHGAHVHWNFFRT